MLSERQIHQEREKERQIKQHANKQSISPGIGLNILQVVGNATDFPVAGIFFRVSSRIVTRVCPMNYKSLFLLSRDTTSSFAQIPPTLCLHSRMEGLLCHRILLLYSSSWPRKAGVSTLSLSKNLQLLLMFVDSDAWWQWWKWKKRWRNGWGQDGKRELMTCTTTPTPYNCTSRSLS